MSDIPQPNQELLSFITTYEDLTNRCDFDLLAPYIAEDAVYWFSNGSFHGKDQIRTAIEATWATIQSEVYMISNIQWLIATTTEAAYIYDFHSDGLVKGQRQQYDGHGTNILQKIDGHWKIVHEHLSKSV